MSLTSGPNVTTGGHGEFGVGKKVDPELYEGQKNTVDVTRGVAFLLNNVL